MLSRCFLDISVGVVAFAIGLSQISSFFSSYMNRGTGNYSLPKGTFILTNVRYMFYTKVTLTTVYST